MAARPAAKARPPRIRRQMSGIGRMAAALGLGYKSAVTSKPTLRSVSIVIEWETGAECGGGRAERCLAELNRQMWELNDRFDAPPELILVLDPGADAPTAAAGLAWPGRFEIAAPSRILDYYSKKNFGFSRSTNDLAVFVDSDLAPEPGWLEALAAPFADAAKSVVVGRTHFETGTLYERAVALFWIFDARMEEALVRPTRRLVSNNIAFRRPLFAALPFPERSTYRGQCSELGARLADLRVTLWEATAARAAHPAPDGPANFIRRAFSAGRDACAYHAIERAVGLGDLGAEWRRDLGSVSRRIVERSPLIGASGIDKAAAAALGTVYYTIKAAGFLTGLARHGQLADEKPAADSSPAPLGAEG